MRTPLSVVAFILEYESTQWSTEKKRRTIANSVNHSHPLPFLTLSRNPLDTNQEEFLFERTG